MTRTQRLTLTTAVLLALALLGTLLYLQFRPGPNLNVQEGGGYEGQPTLGRPRAPVKLILFENFLCEHCKAFEADTFGRLEEAYIGTGQVEAYYVNLAWGNESAVTAGRAREISRSGANGEAVVTPIRRTSTASPARAVSTVRRRSDSTRPGRPSGVSITS